MNTMFGWISRRLGKLRATPVRPKGRPVRVASYLDSLERREVLSTATLSPFLALPSVVVATTSSTAPVPAPTTSVSSTPYLAYVYPQANGAAPIITPASTGTAPASPSVYYYGQSVVGSPVAAISTSNPGTAYVESLYQNVLGRVGGQDEVSSWLAKTDAGMTVQQVAQGFINSTEHRQDEVSSYYEEFLHRSADPSSAGWVTELKSGVSEEKVVEGILDSAEFQSAHQDPTLFVNDLYLDVLGRHGEASGVASWVSALSSGTTRPAVVADFVESSEANDQAVESFYESYLHRDREYRSSQVWSDMLNQGDSVTDVAVGILSSGEYVQAANASQ